MLKRSSSWACGSASRGSRCASWATASSTSIAQLVLSGVFNRLPDPDLHIFFAKTRLGCRSGWRKPTTGTIGTPLGRPAAPRQAAGPHAQRVCASPHPAQSPARGAQSHRAAPPLSCRARAVAIRNASSAGTAARNRSAKSRALGQSGSMWESRWRTSQHALVLPHRRHSDRQQGDRPTSRRVTLMDARPSVNRGNRSRSHRACRRSGALGGIGWVVRAAVTPFRFHISGRG